MGKPFGRKPKNQQAYSHSKHSKKSAFAIVLTAFTALLHTQASASTQIPQHSLVGETLPLEVLEDRTPNEVYRDFCLRFPSECQIQSQFTDQDLPDLSDPQVEMALRQTQQAVNEEIHFQLDQITYNKEEYWSLPLSGFGDCEDNALEKRHRLRALGIPNSALRMATAFHKEKYYAHALLIVRTQQGPIVLDQDSSQPLRLKDAPYIFESAERSNGMWERYLQDW
tara:strand:- start:4356 stop:5030 length:675 start_codon:yes stop_codon:yes gene_type:complete